MRAKRGGEYGVNGEHYDGGQFLPGSPYTVKGANKDETKKRMTRKQEIAPYCWRIDPEGRQAIWPKIEGYVEFVGETWYTKETGKIGTVRLYPNFRFDALKWTAEGLAEFQKLIDRWNNGERWI
jgi:hypothetical protein